MGDRNAVDLPAGIFSYLERGQGEPVVFLHALGRSASDWIPIIEIDTLKREWWGLFVNRLERRTNLSPAEVRLLNHFKAQL